MIIGIFSLLIAAFSGTVHSIGALAAVEIERRWGATRTDQRQILIGRLVSVFVVLLAIVGVSFLRSARPEQIATIVLLEGAIAVPFLVILFGGILSARMNAIGATLALVLGGGFGVGVVVLRILSPDPSRHPFAMGWLWNLTPTELLAAVGVGAFSILVAGSLAAGRSPVHRPEGLTSIRKTGVRSVQ